MNWNRPNLSIDRGAVAACCWRHHIRRLALFGSALRDDFSPDSDVDALVEFESRRTPRLAFFAMQDELSGLFGRAWSLLHPIYGEGRIDSVSGPR